VVNDGRPWTDLYPSWVPPTLPVPTESAIELFEASARADPERPCIHYFDGTLTYGAVDRMAEGLADALGVLGLARGDRVALYLQNVPQFAIAQYAVWKAGGIVVPLNPMFRETELTYHLNDSGARILIALESLYDETARSVVPRTGVQRVVTTSELDCLPAELPRPALLTRSRKVRFAETLDFVELAQDAPGVRGRSRVGPDDVAYLTYTSGTTGVPKGAMNTHTNVVYNSRLYAVWMQLGPADVVLGVAPLFHITGMIAHLGAAAAAGAPVVLGYRFDAGEILRLIERWGATFAVGSITAFIALADHPTVRTRDLRTLRKVYSGGAPVAPAVVRRFRELTGAYIHNVYGLTETTSPSHAVPLGREAPVDPATGALSVGIPIPGAVARIVDLESGTTELPPGETGEIAIRGPMVVAGYWGKPEETAYAIRDGWLHTGDVGTRDARGWFYLVDRKKDLINAAGYKVWPREVEDVLYQHPAVREAAVVGVPDPYRGETVKAFVALHQDDRGRVTPAALIEFCRTRLAAYKYPREVEIVAEIPKTATGKFLRRVLRGAGPTP
jgi:long-chain acyl-CoA synthetase